MRVVSELIEKLETTVDVTQINVKFKDKSFEVYPWIKPYIFSYVQSENKPQNSNTSKWFQVGQLFKGWTRLFKKSKTIIFSNSLERRLFRDGVYDKLFHEISMLDNLKPSRTIEARFPSSNYSIAKYVNQSVSSRSIFYLKELLYAKIFLRNIKCSEIEPLLKFLKENDIEIDWQSALRKNLAQYIVMGRYLRKQTKLESVFLSAAYTNFGLVIAAKELGLKVIELQHGVIGKEHYGYYYSYMPQENQFPDYLLTFGTRDEEFINNGNLSHLVSGYPLGSFIIDHYLKQTEANKLPIAFDVAVSLQDCSTGVEMIDDLILLAESNPSLNFALKRRRLARAFYEEKYRFPKNMVFVEDMDVYELILSSKVHLTAYSSCVLEAPSLGRPNVMFNKHNKAVDYYNKKLDPQFSVFCETVVEMQNAIMSLIDAYENEQAIQISNEKNIAAHYRTNLNNFVKKNL